MLICPHSGIGNQIGNYIFGQFLLYLGTACYSKVSNENEQSVDLKFLFSEDETIDRTFVLNKFNTNFPCASKEDIKRFLKAKTAFPLYFVLIKNIKERRKEYFNSYYKILKRIRKEYGICPLKTPSLMAKTVSYRNVLKNISKDGSRFLIQKKLIENTAVCDCYSPIKEFYDPIFREEMRKHFILKEKLDKKNLEILEKIKSCKNSVGVHIRRGDYIGLKIPVVKKEFLFEKMSFLNEKFGGKNKAVMQDNVQFFIFSDSMDWAMKNLQSEDVSNLHFVDINDESKGYLDFVLLNNCRHRIYSASSFSKWISFLNPYENSIEFTPKEKDLVVE